MFAPLFKQRLIYSSILNWRGHPRRFTTRMYLEQIIGCRGSMDIKMAGKEIKKSFILSICHIFARVLLSGFPPGL